MCTTCGCTDDGATIDGIPHHTHGPGGTITHHHHAASHHHAPPEGPSGGTGPHQRADPAASHASGPFVARMIEIETDILAKNDRFAARNRDRLGETGTLALNLVSSPGSGKTALLVATIAAIGERYPAAVIEGDQQTANDADRIRATGAPAVQINTGKGCHLDAHMVGHAIDRLPLAPLGVLFIENVGNLVCPAAFDLGERAKVAILSVTEGEDKPLKYPDMFAAAGLVIINKIDLAEPCDVDLDLIEANARRVNPGVRILRLSARTGEGMSGWLEWLDEHRVTAVGQARAVEETGLAAVPAE